MQICVKIAFIQRERKKKGDPSVVIVVVVIAYEPN